MASKPSSLAVRPAAHQLFQFVLGCVLEQVEVVVTDVEAYLTTLGVPNEMWREVYQAFRAEANYRRSDVPEGTDELYAQVFELDVIMSICAVDDADLALMDRQAALWDTETARQCATY